jgi:hypothetical protein
MLTKSSSALAAGHLEEATVWAGQAVLATHDSTDLDTRRKVTSHVTAIAVRAVIEVRKSAFTAGALHKWMATNVDVIERCASLLSDMAAGGGRELALAQALVVGGFAKQLSSAIAPHRSTVYAYTKAEDLDDFLKTLADLMEAASRLTVEPTPDTTTESERVKLVCLALSNAQHSLSALFSRKLSDWDKARVLTRHARKLAEASHSTLLPAFDEADQALAAFDYGKSSRILKDLETGLSTAS